MAGLKRPIGSKAARDVLGNLPGGWHGYTVSRPTMPPRIDCKRHGNYVHGGRSREGIAGMSMVRLLGRLLFGSLYAVPPGFFSRPVGWRVWPHKAEWRAHDFDKLDPSAALIGLRKRAGPAGRWIRPDARPH